MVKYIIYYLEAVMKNNKPRFKRYDKFSCKNWILCLPAWSAVDVRTFYVPLKPNTYLNM